MLDYSFNHIPNHILLRFYIVSVVVLVLSIDACIQYIITLHISCSYGGKGFSAHGHSQVVQMISTRYPTILAFMS